MKWGVSLPSSIEFWRVRSSNWCTTYSTGSTHVPRPTWHSHPIKSASAHTYRHRKKCTPSLLSSLPNFSSWWPFKVPFSIYRSVVRHICRLSTYTMRMCVRVSCQVVRRGIEETDLCSKWVHFQGLWLNLCGLWMDCSVSQGLAEGDTEVVGLRPSVFVCTPIVCSVCVCMIVWVSAVMHGVYKYVCVISLKCSVIHQS